MPPKVTKHRRQSSWHAFFLLKGSRIRHPKIGLQGFRTWHPKYATLTRWLFWETANVGRGFLSIPLMFVRQTLQKELYRLSLLPTFPESLISQERLTLIAGGKARSWHHCVLSHFGHVQHSATLWTIAHQAPLSLGLSRQEYRSALPCPPPGNLPNPGIKPASLTSPALAGRSVTSSATWHHIQTNCVTNGNSSCLWFYEPICLS